MIELTEKRCSDGACACGVEPLAHPRYSFGMLLEARHLALEHRYGAMRMNTHDIRLHDFGTVCGLHVDKHPARECVNKFAILRPGIALDCCGREIVVPEDLYVPLHDGARSGWCGSHEPYRDPKTPALTAAAAALTTTTFADPAMLTATTFGRGTVMLPQQPAGTLYIYLRYRECETDPIPTYVRECGCCGDDCEHGSCVPSVIREGYEVFVTTTPPPPWRNPVAHVFCAWLESRIKGPGMSRTTALLGDMSLDKALCMAVTQPCADICDAAGDALLLATVTFNVDGNLTDIDNCTDRRLVISTGAMFGAIECLAEAVAACCKKKAFLTLAGAVTPQTVDLAQFPAPKPELVYTVTVKNADASEAAGPFTLELAFPAGLTFKSASLVVAAAPPTQPGGDATGVKAGVAGLAAGVSAVLTVTAAYDPTAQHAGGTLDAKASIAAYDGDAGPPIALTTTFIEIPIPRVITAILKQKPTMTIGELESLLRSTSGIVLPFTTEMNEASAVAEGPGQTVFLEALQDGNKVGEGPTALEWIGPRSLHVHLAPNPADAVMMFLKNFLAKPAESNVMRIRLLGGPDGGGGGAAALTATDGKRLDGEPPKGGPFPDESGNGTEGGDFVWDVTIEVPVVVDGPHVIFAKSKLADRALPNTLSLNDALVPLFLKGFFILFDEPMDNTVPPDKAISSPSAKLTVDGTTIKSLATWSADALTLRVVADRAALDAAFSKIANTGGKLALTLAGGVKNAAAPAAGVMRSRDATRSLDGDPPTGTGALHTAGKSGDLRQGGNFVWRIDITPLAIP